MTKLFARRSRRPRRLPLRHRQRRPRRLLQGAVRTRPIRSFREAGRPRPAAIVGSRAFMPERWRGRRARSHRSAGFTRIAGRARLPRPRDPGRLPAGRAGQSRTRAGRGGRTFSGAPRRAVPHNDRPPILPEAAGVVGASDRPEPLRALYHSPYVRFPAGQSRIESLKTSNEERPMRIRTNARIVRPGGGPGAVQRGWGARRRRAAPGDGQGAAWRVYVAARTRGRGPSPAESCEGRGLARLTKGSRSSMRSPVQTARQRNPGKAQTKLVQVRPRPSRRESRRGSRRTCS